MCALNKGMCCPLFRSVVIFGAHQMKILTFNNIAAECLDSECTQAPGIKFCWETTDLGFESNLVKASNVVWSSAHPLIPHLLNHHNSHF